jgi:hypothetical protein
MTSVGHLFVQFRRFESSEDLAFMDPISLIYPNLLQVSRDFGEDRGFHITLDRGWQCQSALSGCGLGVSHENVRACVRHGVESLALYAN